VFAIITSFTGFVYGLKDFYNDITSRFPQLLKTADSRATVVSYVYVSPFSGGEPKYD